MNELKTNQIEFNESVIELWDITDRIDKMMIVISRLCERVEELESDNKALLEAVFNEK